MSITTLAFIMVALYTVFTLYVGLGMGYKKEVSKTASGYFLGGGTKLFILYMTTAASWFSTFIFTGAAGSFYLNGVGFVGSILWQLIIVMLMGVVGIKFWVLAHKFDYITPADMLDDYYQSDVLRKIITIMQMIFLVPHMMAQTTGVGLAFQIITNGMVPYWVGVFYVAIVVGVYVYKGGFRAQAWVDTAQGILFTAVMWISVFLLLSLPQVGGAGNMFTYLSENTDLLQYHFAPKAWTWKMYASFFFAQGLGGFLAPYVWQRMYAADNPNTVKKLAGTVGPFYTFAVMFPVLLIGFAGAVLYPNIKNPDTILMTAAFDHFPVWAVFVTVGIMAAGMSTISSQLICSASLFSIDIIKPMRPDMSSEKISALGKKVVLGTLVIVVLLSLIQVRSILLLSNLALSGFAQTIFPLIGIFFWKRATTAGAIAGMVVGIFMVAFFNFVIVNPFGFLSSIYGLIGNGVTFVVVSLLTKPIDPKVQARFDKALE